MISKSFPAHSFYHACQYVSNKKGAELLISEGVRGHDPTLMAQDFLSQQQMRPSKTMACFHATLSFYPGENPSDELMKKVAQEYLTRLGIVNTQFTVIKHTDTDHLHMHVVANMVDNNGKAIPDRWIGLRGKRIAQQLTREYGLIPAQGKNMDRTHLESLRQSDVEKYKIYQAIATNLPYCRTLETLQERLLSLGIETLFKYKGQTKEKQGISFKMGNACFKGSQVDRQFSLAGLSRIIAENLKPEGELSSNQAITWKHSDHWNNSDLERNNTDGEIAQTEISENSETEPSIGGSKAWDTFVDIMLKTQVPSGGSGGPVDDPLRKKKKKKRRNL